MADPLKQMCEELGVCTEEALFYLEGFRWDLTAATEACRSKTLPSLAADQPPSSENERAAAEEQTGDEKIARLVGETEATEEEAIDYLSRNNWSVDHASRSFRADRFDPPEKKQKTVPLSSHAGHAEKWYMRGFSGSGGGSDLVQEVLSNVPQFRDPSSNIRIGSTPSASTPRVELTPESIKQFRDVVSEASPSAVLDCLNYSEGNVTAAIGHYYDHYFINTSGMAVDQDSSTESLQQHIPEDKPLVSSSQVEESGNPTQTLPPKRDESAELKEEHIGSFIKMTGETREDAIAYLKHFKWNVNEAVKFFEENGYSGEVLSALSMSLMGSDDLPLPSSPTETQRSLEKAGEGDVTVAVPGMAKAHVKENVKDVEEDLGTEISAVPIATTTVELEISLDDGGSRKPVWIRVRSDQTVRDIRNRIDAFRPEDKREYYIKSATGVEYRDLDTTVHSIISGSRGSTTLHQMYST